MHDARPRTDGIEVNKIDLAELAEFRFAIEDRNRLGPADKA
jgi:hypothetical protein